MVTTVEGLALEQFRVEYDDEEPVLVYPDGRQVDTWKEGYPYPERLSRDEYELAKRRLQIELLKLQGWVKDSGARVLILFEGRDAAGKGGTIKRFMEHLNPRGARVVALEKPSERERGEWYFQRYIQHLPTAGEIVLSDRSWYNRAGVERVMGYCTDDQYAEFMVQAPDLERLLVRDGISLFKLWFSPSSAPGSSSAGSTRSGNGSCPPPTWRHWTSGAPTPRPRRPCSGRPTPSGRRGRW